MVGVKIEDMMGLELLERGGTDSELLLVVVSEIVMKGCVNLFNGWAPAGEHLAVLLSQKRME